MISFEKSRIEDKEILERTARESFIAQSVIDYGNENVVPPHVASGKIITLAIEKNLHLFSIKSDDEIIGGIIIEEKENKEYYLQTIWICETYQNQGIGNKAMEFIENTFSDAKSWSLETPSKAERNRYFYEKWGYVKVKEEEYGDSGVILVDYKKEIV